MALTLDVDGRLTITAGDAPFQVEFRGDVVALVLPDLRAARTLGRTFTRLERRAWLRSFQALLGRTGLELQVWVGTRQVARLAGVTRTGRLAVWLGLDPLELQVRAVLATLARRRLPRTNREFTP